MPLNKYRVLAKIAERGKMRLAAQDLMYSKQNMSRIIKDLEEECGFDLFIRDRDGVQLTEEAKEILPLVNKIIEEEDALLDQIESIRKRHMENVPSVSIGACGGAVVDLVHKALNECQGKCDFPISTEFFVDGDHFVDGLNSGKMDFALVVDGYQRDYKFQTLCKDRFVAIRANREGVDVPKSISIKEVLKHPTIMTPDSPFFEDIMKDTSCSRISVDDEIIMVPIVEKSDYYGIAAQIPYFYPEDDAIDIIPLEEEEYRTIGIATCPGKKLSEEAIQVISVFKNIINNRAK